MKKLTKEEVIAYRNALLKKEEMLENKAEALREKSDKVYARVRDLGKQRNEYMEKYSAQLAKYKKGSKFKFTNGITFQVIDFSCDYDDFPEKPIEIGYKMGFKANEPHDYKYAEFMEEEELLMGIKEGKILVCSKEDWEIPYQANLISIQKLDSETKYIIGLETGIFMLVDVPENSFDNKEPERLQITRWHNDLNAFSLEYKAKRMRMYHDFLPSYYFKVLAVFKEREEIVEYLI